MRNKKHGFPERMNLDGARAKSAYSSKRPDGTTNTDPQGRMLRSSHRDKQ